MKAALDVHYEGGTARAACVIFEEWPDSAPWEVLRTSRSIPSPYQAGRFYQRELPCLLAALESSGLHFDAIVIDGYVDLRSEVGEGLGRRLFDSLPYRPVVVGVAKNPLRVAERFVPVLRGRSGKPLYVSAAGCPLPRAASLIKQMHGRHRIPTLLAVADREARGAGAR